MNNRETEVNIVKKYVINFAITSKNTIFAMFKGKDEYISCYITREWKIGRVTECAGLEIRYTVYGVSGV